MRAIIQAELLLDEPNVDHGLVTWFDVRVVERAEGDGANSEDYQVRIDYVFASPSAAERVTHVERVSLAQVEVASDHYPLFVDVAL